MIAPADEPKPREPTWHGLVDAVAPGGRVVGERELVGSFSNDSRRVELESSDGRPILIVCRRYASHGESPTRKALREFAALELLRGRPGVPTPEPLLLDADGALLGSPGIVTRFMAGECAPLEQAAGRWSRRCRSAAVTLARIHDVPVDLHTSPTLMDANTEALWFLAGGRPGFMEGHPDGTVVWQAALDLRAQREVVEPTLVHLDYWSGNLLWVDDEVSAVVDWEEAGYGDPAIDVAYSLMELYLEGLDGDAEDFLCSYRDAARRPLANLAFWKLAASARPMIDLDGWLTRPGMADRFRRFIDAALREATARSGLGRSG